MTTPMLIEEVDIIELVDSELPMVIETPALQGPPGPPGPIGTVSLSKLADNRLQAKDDGLYVSDNLNPDPLAYYIIARG